MDVAHGFVDRALGSECDVDDPPILVEGRRTIELATAASTTNEPPSKTSPS